MSRGTRRAEVLLASAIPMPRMLGPRLFPDLLDRNPRKGLRRWVDTNMLIPARATRRRGVLVELHHDGTVVTAVDLSRHALPPSHPEVPLPMAAPVLISAVFETIALAHEHRLALRADIPIELRAVLETQPGTGLRFTPVVLAHGRTEVAEWARQPRTVQPAHSELSPFADDQSLITCARDLAEGLLNQFGIDITPT